jgi:hypothetical protein
MGNELALHPIRFRGADLELAIDRNRIAVNDLAPELLCEVKRKGSLAARCGAENDDQRRVGHYLALQTM